jgi:hypothetical protein
LRVVNAIRTAVGAEPLKELIADPEVCSSAGKTSAEPLHWSMGNDN